MALPTCVLMFRMVLLSGEVETQRPLIFLSNGYRVPDGFAIRGS